MNFSVVILGAPYSSQSAATAYRFTEALLAKGHSVYRLFFYHDGVHNGSELAVSPQDETSTAECWHQLIADYQLDAVVCIASALRRGVLNSDEAVRYDKGCANLRSYFAVVGLGDLVEAAQQSDRLITFGP